MKAGMLNIAANTTHKGLGGRGPIFDNSTFKYIPIPEGEITKKSVTYNELGLQEYVKDKKIKYVHYDPEFKTYTHGEWKRLTKNFKELEEGDYLFFLASLENKKKKKWGFYIIGYFKLKKVKRDVRPPYSKDFLKKYGNNAHVRRGKKEEGSFYIYKGVKKNSALLKKAVPFDKKLANKFLKTMADNTTPLDWKDYKDKELMRINHFTRPPRVVKQKSQINALWGAIDKVNPGQSKIAGHRF